MNTAAITAEAWVSITSALDASNGDAVVSRYGAGGFSWLLGRWTNGRPLFQVYRAAGGSVAVYGPSALTPGQTYHMVGTYDGITARLYLDGVEVGSAALAGSLATPSRTPPPRPPPSTRSRSTAPRSRPIGSQPTTRWARRPDRASLGPVGFAHGSPQNTSTTP